MGFLSGLFEQENKKLRHFQIVYTILTLNFVIPAFSYLFTPESAWEGFLLIGRIFGSTDYPYSEQSYYWRILGAGNVMTLGFMCGLILMNLRKYFTTLVPLVFLKACSAFGFLAVYLWVIDYSLFLVAFVFDGFTLVAMIYFAVTAHRSLEPNANPARNHGATLAPQAG